MKTFNFRSYKYRGMTIDQPCACFGRYFCALLFFIYKICLKVRSPRCAFLPHLFIEESLYIPNCLQELMQKLSSSNQLMPLLEVLMLLPEEVDSRHLRLGANRHAFFYHHLKVFRIHGNLVWIRIHGPCF